MQRRFLLTLFWGLCWLVPAAAQFISRPELVGFNSPSPQAVFCPNFQFYVKFDIDQFGGPQTLTIQLSNAVGDFSIPVAIGTVTTTSGAQQNIHAVATIPASATPGTGYRLRLRANSNGTLSQSPNEFAFAITSAVPLPINDPNAYGNNQWMVHTYSFLDPLGADGRPFGGVMNSAQIAAINMFGTDKYRGYFVINNLNFDNTWTRPVGIPGTGNPNISIDASHLCGTQFENYALRLRRRHTFAAGTYQISMRGDDGFRLSLDGGNTFVIDQFNEQPLATGCATVTLEAGQREVVLEFFQRRNIAVLGVQFVQVSGPPAFPAGLNGSTICSTQAAFQLNATPAGGVYTSDPAAFVTPSGMFNPGAQGVSANVPVLTLTYAIGYGSCRQTTTATVSIVPGSNAAFTGLNSSGIYCSTDAAVTLVPSSSGGTFTGPGVSGNTFTPSAALPAGQDVVTGEIVHTIGTGACAGIVRRPVTVYRSVSAITVAPTTGDICFGSGAVALPVSTPTAVISGPGVTAGVFDPIAAGFDNAALAAQTYTFTYTYAGGTPCQRSTTITRRMVPRLPAPAMTISGTVCPAANITVNISNAANYPAGTNFSWNIPGVGVQNTTTPSIAINNLGTSGTITCTPRFPGSTCDGETGSLALAIPTLPTLNFSAIPRQCLNGSAVTLTATPAGGTFSGPGVSGNQFNPATAGASLTGHTITYTVNTSGCVSTTTQTVVVVANPPTPVLSAPTVCAGQNLTITLTNAAAFGPGTVFSWTGPNGFSASGTANSITIVSATLAAGGSYSCVANLPAPDAACTSPAGTVTANVVDNSPVVFNAVGPLCQGAAPVTLVATPVGGTFTGPGVTGNQFNPTGLTPGVYTVSYTIGVPPCQRRADRDIFINAVPARPVVPNFATVCGGSLNIAVTSPVAGLTYNWTGPGGFSGTGTSITVSSPVTGTYSVVAVSPQNCTSSPGSTQVVVGGAPVAPVVSGIRDLCTGDQLLLSVNGPISGATYSWTFPGGISGPNGDVLVRPNVTTAAAGTYVVTVNVPGCGSASTNVVVSVAQRPSQPDFSANGGTTYQVCEGDPLVLRVLSPESGVTYTWTGPGLSGPATGETLNLGAATAAMGTADFILTASAGACTAPQRSRRLTVTPRPAAPVPVSAAVTVCAGNPAVLQVQDLAGAVWQWMGPGGVPIALTDRILNIPTAMAADAGDYTVRATVRGCQGPAVTIRLTVQPAVSAPVVTGLRNFCEGEEIILRITQQTGETYQWSRNGITEASGDTYRIPSASIANGGSYIVSASNGTCTRTTAFDLVIRANPPVEPVLVNGTICGGQSATLSLPNAYSNIRWSTGALTPAITVSRAGTYTVTYANAAGCSQQSRVELSEDDCVNDLHIADAFTPNGDGHNDEFKIQGAGVINFEIRIYNRWGENIFYSNDLNKSWDGKFGGLVCPAGEYHYVIDYQMTSRGAVRSSTRKGFFSLLK